MTDTEPTPRRARPKLLNLLLVGVSVLFPLIALLLARPFGPVAVTLGLIAVLLLRTVFGGFAKDAQAIPAWPALAVTAALAVLTFIDADLAMRLYPVLMNVAMLLVFARSLVRPPSMIERFARLVEPDLPPSGVIYTRKVTWVWCGFFVLNGSVAMWTALAGSLEAWALYNGVVAYVLMGAILAGELLVRNIVRAGESENGKHVEK